MALTSESEVVETMSVRVLLAEHHPLIRRRLRRVIEEEPDLQVVAEAFDSRQAIEMVEAHVPDVAIVDQDTPVNGIETTRRIRDCSPATQVVVYSVHSDDVYVSAALAAGAAAFVAADSADDDLVLAVREALGGGFFASVVVPPP
jgi:DNA-binding NarL/FixJ family response regulator